MYFLSTFSHRAFHHRGWAEESPWLWGAMYRGVLQRERWQIPLLKWWADQSHFWKVGHDYTEKWCLCPPFGFQPGENGYIEWCVMPLNLSLRKQMQHKYIYKQVVWVAQTTMEVFPGDARNNEPGAHLLSALWLLKLKLLTRVDMLLYSQVHQCAVSSRNTWLKYMQHTLYIIKLIMVYELVWFLFQFECFFLHWTTFSLR